MRQHGSLEWTRHVAEQEADKAIMSLKVLPESPWRSALEALAHMSVQREF